MDEKRIVELESEIEKALKIQNDLVNKYKSVKHYRMLQQDIFLMRKEIENIHSEEEMFGNGN